MYGSFVFVLMFLFRSVSSVSSRRLAFVSGSRASLSVIDRFGRSSRQDPPYSNQFTRHIDSQYHYAASNTLTSSTSIRRFSASTTSQESFFAEDTDFKAMGVQSQALLRRLEQMGLERPTTVQNAAYQQIRQSHHNVTIGAETGSGKVSLLVAMVLCAR